jgi:hypothetical protein
MQKKEIHSILEDYRKEEIGTDDAIYEILLLFSVVGRSEQLCSVCKNGSIDNDYGCTNQNCKCYPFQ